MTALYVCVCVCVLEGVYICMHVCEELRTIASGIKTRCALFMEQSSNVS